MERLDVFRSRPAATNLDAKSKRSAAHFRSPWQQSVNVFGSWSRPACVEELHQEAQLNLQSLLQDFEETLYDSKLTGQTFRHLSSQSSEDTSLSRSPVSLNKPRPDFIFLPSSSQLLGGEDETSSSSSLGLRTLAAPSPSPAPSPCGSDRPLVAWGSSAFSPPPGPGQPPAPPPPVAEKPRWHFGRRTPAHLIPLEVTGEGKHLGVDLLQCSPSPSPSDYTSHHPLYQLHQPRSLEPVTDTPLQHLPLRKTYSDLDTSLQSPQEHLDHLPVDQLTPGTTTTMDHSGLLCSNTSWNGPKGSTFSPGVWNEAYSYSINPGMGKTPPAVPPKQQGLMGNVGGGGLSVSSGSQSSSFTSISEPSGGSFRGVAPMGMVVTMGRRSETEGAASAPQTADGGGRGGEARKERSARSVAAARAFKFRERSLSTPNDSASLCSADDAAATGNGNAGNATPDHYQHHHHPFLRESGAHYALLYPSGSSEDSLSVSDYGPPSSEGRLVRTRSRSISLKKSKRKPPPPVRSVSLMKNLADGDGVQAQGARGLYRDGRPKSLHIPRDGFPDFQPDFLLLPPLPSSCPSKPRESDLELGHAGSNGPPSLEVQGPDREAEVELSYPSHWQLGDWKASDPYRSLSGSSTATGTTVIECAKARGSAESLLDSPPSLSRSVSPCRPPADPKPPSPFRPLGLMSPSSGYSSQSEAPTPTAAHPSAGSAPSSSLATAGCRMRPKIPERKSSLPSPKDPAARCRMSFEMPAGGLPDLSALKPKPKAGRRHSDTSSAAKPGKVGPSPTAPPPLPPTTAPDELRSVRLRAVSRGDLDDCPDGASDTVEEEEGRRGVFAPAPKLRPPVAVKPPLPRRPFNLLLKGPSPQGPDSPPASPLDSPVERPIPLGNIYKVMRKPKPKKTPPPPHLAGTPKDPTFAPAFAPASPHGLYDLPFLPHSQSLYDLPPLPDPQPLLEDAGPEVEFGEPETERGPGPEDGGSLPSPCTAGLESQELQDKSKTLPSRMTISCLAELDRKKAKVPPPVPKKPCVLLLPSSVHSSTGSLDRHTSPGDSPVGLRSTPGASSPDGPPSTPGVPPDVPPDFPPCVPPEVLPDVPAGEEENHFVAEEQEEGGSKEEELQEPSLADGEGKEGVAVSAADDAVDDRSSLAGERVELHITEETDSDVTARTPTTHTTEDLFTLIHRSKRKVLGRKEPQDSFGSRQSLTSPVKHSAGGGGDLRTMTLGGVPRSSSRNDTFMALLQKKGGKSSGAGARVSAMELLKSTNPLARRVNDFSSSSATTTTTPPPPSSASPATLPEAEGGGGERE